MGKTSTTWRPLLAYSTNVHRGESLADVYRFLDAYTIPIRKRLFGKARAGLELRLGIGSATELKKPAQREAFRGYLEENGLVPFSINAYPLRNFHSKRVKKQVYLPSWADAQRSRWTTTIAEIFAELLPTGMTGTISTLGGAYKPAEPGPGILRKIASNYLKTLEALARIEQATGKRILLAVEPEPYTTFETAADVIEFFESYLFPQARSTWRRRGLSATRTEERLRKFFTVNYDTCHFSVLFQDQVQSLRSLRRAGLKVGKVHVTNAISLANPHRAPLGYKEFRGMDEPRYFHQFCGKETDGNTRWRGPDLKHLPVKFGSQQPTLAELRSHYHVPIYLQKWRRLKTTRDETRKALLEVLRTRQCEHLVIETYTWPLLEKEDRLVRGIAKEFRWLLKILAEMGVERQL